MYPSCLDSRQWTLIQPHIPQNTGKGHPQIHSYRSIFNAIFYILRSDCAWRMLPKDFPPWTAVYYHFRKWKKSGLFEKICHILRRKARVNLGRKPEPTAAILDSQSAKSIAQPGCRGYDGNKKVKGRKRHIVVDVEGFLLQTYVSEANKADSTEARELFLRLQESGFVDLELIWADQGYQGTLEEWTEVFTWWRLEILKRTMTADSFEIQPRRWVVERTFGWFVNYRRFAREYEQLVETSEAMLYLAMLRVLLDRLTRSKQPNHRGS